MHRLLSKASLVIPPFRSDAVSRRTYLSIQARHSKNRLVVVKMLRALLKGPCESRSWTVDVEKANFKDHVQYNWFRWLMLGCPLPESLLFSALLFGITTWPQKPIEAISNETWSKSSKIQHRRLETIWDPNVYQFRDGSTSGDRREGTLKLYTHNTACLNRWLGPYPEGAGTETVSSLNLRDPSRVLNPVSRAVLDFASLGSGQWRASTSLNSIESTLTTT